MANLIVSQALFRRWHELVHERARLAADLTRMIGDNDRELDRVTAQIIASGALDVVAPPVPPASAAVAQSVEDAESATKQQQLLEMLGDGGRIEHAELAEELFGEDSRYNRRRVRQMLWYLGKTGKVKNRGYRIWEVVK